MTENNLQKDSLEQWASMWDEIRDEEEKNPSSQLPQDHFQSNQTLGLGHSAPPDTQDLYYGYLEDEILSEQQKTPNPVYPDSVGPDYTTTPPVWVSEEIVKEITTLKDKLFEVENKLAKMGGDNKWSEKAQISPEGEKLLGEIKSLREKIDKMSNTLGVEHEPSPWVVHKD